VANEGNIVLSNAPATAVYSIAAANVKTVNVQIDDGAGDMANFYDGSGNDTFEVSLDGTNMVYRDGASRVNVAGLQGYVLNVSNTGVDTAVILDGTGDDTFTAADTAVFMSYESGPSRGVGMGAGFEIIEGRSRSGNDTAILTGTAGNDSLFSDIPAGGTTPIVRFTLAGAPTMIVTSGGFKTITVQPLAGTDTATFDDGPGNDALTLAQAYTDMKYSGTAYRVTADSAFEFVTPMQPRRTLKGSISSTCTTRPATIRSAANGA